MGDCYTTSVLATLRQRLEPTGLNLFGVAAVRDYDARVPPRLQLAPRWPEARTAVVIGGGGGSFWNAALAQRDLAAADAPLDRFAERCVESLALDLFRDCSPVTLYPHRFSEEPVSFVHLAECASLGVPSLLGILIRPDYGTWFALRAAVLIASELPVTPRLGFDPCPPCDKPCVAACPVHAVRSSTGWDAEACAAHRMARNDCGDGCSSRLACPWGREHEYPLEAQRHHQGHALAAMRRFAASRTFAPGATATAKPSL